MKQSKLKYMKSQNKNRKINKKKEKLLSLAV